MYEYREPLRGIEEQFILNPLNAETTFTQYKRKQNFLKLI